MRKARLLSLFAVGSLAITLICLIGIPGAQANQGMDDAVSAAPSSFEILHSFAGCTNDGAYPHGSLILSDARYGVTYWGGNLDQYGKSCGTIFKFDTKKNVYAVLHSFAGKDGARPWGSLTLSGATLYGVTYAGGANPGNGTGNGTIFKFNTRKNIETVLTASGRAQTTGIGLRRPSPSPGQLSTGRLSLEAPTPAITATAWARFSSSTPGKTLRLPFTASERAQTMV